MIFLWVLFFIAGCGFQLASTPKFPYELMLQTTDLPIDFVRTGGSFPEISGGFSHLVGFSSNPDVIGIGISHQITIYPDVNSAKDSFPKWENEWLTNTWSVTLVVYTPLDIEDQHILKCRSVTF